ncbi:MAG: multidrug efflux SMR transporter [Planctomycetota bacterium]|nr:multidrug efflux SMR transporter [Planctomycetota bacterium]
MPHGFPILFAAILAEVGATLALRESQAFARPALGFGALAGYGLAFWLLAQSLTTVPLGIAYGVWAGLGTVGIVLAGWALFNEVPSPSAWLGIGFVVLGVSLLGTGLPTR